MNDPLNPKVDHKISGMPDISIAKGPALTLALPGDPVANNGQMKLIARCEAR